MSLFEMLFVSFVVVCLVIGIAGMFKEYKEKGAYWRTLHNIDAWKRAAFLFGFEVKEYEKVVYSRISFVRFYREARVTLRGFLNNLPITIQLFRNEVSASEHPETKLRQFIVYSAEFEGDSPFFVLDWFHFGRENAYNEITLFPVKKPYHDDIDLYAPTKYEIEALTVFDQDFLETLKNSQWNFDVEVRDGRIFCVRQIDGISADEIIAESKVVVNFIKELTVRLEKLNFTRIGDLTPKLQGRPLRDKASIDLKLVLFIIVFMYSVVFFILFLHFKVYNIS